ncbi:MAG: GNAT family N-acetyltransferase [Desulfobacteraceae bacterium]|nr:GNAT family N-acetyltransferase [Desulfobacteraceae bacterium]
MKEIEIIDTNNDNILKYGICGYKNIKRAGFPEKIEWMKKRFAEGLKIKTLYSAEGGTQGMIEYISGEYCWRPVEATGYTFIHCIFSGFKRTFKNKGYGSRLLDECLKDAKKEKTYGVAVVTRKGSFMVDSRIFLKHGFEVVDTASPDFALLVKKFNKASPVPKFKSNWGERLEKYNNGLTIIRADQCPYSVKNVNEISKTAKEEFGVKPNVISLNNCKEAQNSPCAFGTFCIILNGKIVAWHPISNGRFRNIMNKIKK